MTINKDFQYQDTKYLFGIIRKFTSGLLLSLFLSGCAHVISEDILKGVDKEISFEELLEDPDKYQGKIVLLGGVIVKTENKQHGTILEIYQTELDSYGRPINTDVSQGRFLALYEEFLDSEIYRKGRRVTVAGVVRGVEVMKLGDIDYHYPYLLVKEIHLWKEGRRHEIGLYHRDLWCPSWWDLGYYRWYHPYYFNRWYPQSEDEGQDNDK